MSESELKLKGSYRKDRHGDRTTAADTANEVPERPDDLSADAATLWDHIVDQRRDYLAQSDSAALEALCRSWAILRAAMRLLEANPSDRDARLTYSQSFGAVEKLLGRFGCDPAARAKLGEVRARPRLPIDDYLA